MDFKDKKVLIGGAVIFCSISMISGFMYARYENSSNQDSFALEDTLDHHINTEALVEDVVIEDTATEEEPEVEVEVVEEVDTEEDTTTSTEEVVTESTEDTSSSQDTSSETQAEDTTNTTTTETSTDTSITIVPTNIVPETYGKGDWEIKYYNDDCVIAYFEDGSVYDYDNDIWWTASQWVTYMLLNDITLEL